MRCLRTIAVFILVGLPTGCALETAPTRSPASQETRPAASTSRPLDARQMERVQRIMMPLLRATNNPRLLNEIRVRVIDDPNINAANAGGGEFQLTDLRRPTVVVVFVHAPGNRRQNRRFEKIGMKGGVFSDFTSS